MSDAPSPLKLPPLQQSELDHSTLDRLFADLSECAQILSVVPRHAAQTMVVEKTVTLAEARDALHAGTIRGLQIRYRYDNREWSDTLMPLGPGRIRLVRICTDDALASGAESP